MRDHVFHADLVLVGRLYSTLYLRAASNFSAKVAHRWAALNGATQARVFQLPSPLAFLKRHRAARGRGGGEFIVGEIERHGLSCRPCRNCPFSAPETYEFMAEKRKATKRTPTVERNAIGLFLQFGGRRMAGDRGLLRAAVRFANGATGNIDQSGWVRMGFGGWDARDADLPTSTSCATAGGRRSAR